MSAGEPLSQDEYELWQNLETMYGTDSLLDFVPRLTPKFERPDHLRPFAEILSAAEVEQTFAGVSVPVRHGKTELLLHTIARLLQRHPGWLIGYATYSADQARSKSKDLQEYAYRAGVDFSGTMREWRTPVGGGVLANGIDGRWTGMGIRMLFVDDPFENRKAAESAHKRNEVWRQLRGTLWNRLDPGASIIVNHARWHVDDVIGRCAKDRQIPWTILNLPAIDKRGNALWRARYTEAQLDVMRRLSGPYDWNSLYMGMPMPPEGRLFDVTRIRRLPYVDMRGARIAIACDPAATASTKADFSAIGVMAAWDYGVRQRVHMLEVIRRQCEIPALIRELQRIQRKWGMPVGIEAVGGFKAVPQVMRDAMVAAEIPELEKVTNAAEAEKLAIKAANLRIIEIKAPADKLTRALPFSAVVADGRFSVADAPWTDDYLQELEDFTGHDDPKDDQVDVTAHCFAQLNRVAASIPRGSRLADNVEFG